MDDIKKALEIAQNAVHKATAYEAEMKIQRFFAHRLTAENDRLRKVLNAARLAVGNDPNNSGYCQLVDAINELDEAENDPCEE